MGHHKRKHFFWFEGKPEGRCGLPFRRVRVCRRAPSQGDGVVAAGPPRARCKSPGQGHVWPAHGQIHLMVEEQPSCWVLRWALPTLSQSPQPMHGGFLRVYAFPPETRKKRSPATFWAIVQKLQLRSELWLARKIYAKNTHNQQIFWLCVFFCVYVVISSLP